MLKESFFERLEFLKYMYEYTRRYGQYMDVVQLLIHTEYIHVQLINPMCS